MPWLERDDCGGRGDPSKTHLKGRLRFLQDEADLVVFLASDASCCTNRAAIDIDGDKLLI